MTREDALLDRFDSLHELGATFRECSHGVRRDDEECSVCRYWMPSMSVTGRRRRLCEVWAVEQPARGWCIRFERYVERGSVLGRSAGR